jgi:hypothetical protein
MDWTIGRFEDFWNFELRLSAKGGRMKIAPDEIRGIEDGFNH